MFALFHQFLQERGTSVGISVVESTRIFPSLGLWLLSTKTSCWRRRRQESELFSEGAFSMFINTPAQNRSRMSPVPAIQFSLRIIFYEIKEITTSSVNYLAYHPKFRSNKHANMHIITTQREFPYLYHQGRPCPHLPNQCRQSLSQCLQITPIQCNYR